MNEYKVEDPESYPLKKALILKAKNSAEARRKACKEWNLKINDKFHGAACLRVKKLTNVSLEGKTVCFFFNETNCFKIRSGECSLLASEEFLQQFEDNPYRKKADAYYCRKLSNLVISKDPLKFPIYLHKHKCGHFQSGCGLHRSCIAGHLKVSIPIELGENLDKNCSACETPENGDVLIEF